MRTRALLVGGLVAVAVAIAAISLAPGSTVSASPSPTASQTLALSPPTTTTSPGDLASLVHPLVASWRPSGPVLLIERSDAPGATLLAVPLDGGAATALVALPSPVQLGYDLRDDGSVLAVALAITTNTARIAIWDLASGTTRWLTEEEPGVMQ